MSVIRFKKVLALPGVPTPDTLYFVDGGAVAETYLTDSAGVAHPVGNSQMIQSLVAENTQYTHSQASAAATWIVNHNFGYRPAVAAYTLGGMMMWANVQHIDDNQAQIHFDGPVSGYAVCS